MCLLKCKIYLFIYYIACKSNTRVDDKCVFVRVVLYKKLYNNKNCNLITMLKKLSLVKFPTGHG